VQRRKIIFSNKLSKQYEIGAPGLPKLRLWPGWEWGIGAICAVNYTSINPCNGNAGTAGNNKTEQEAA